MKAIIFDFNRTVYDPEKDELFDGIIMLMEKAKEAGFSLYLVAKGGEERQMKIKSLDLPKYFRKIIVRPEKTRAEFEDIMKEAEPETAFFVLGDRTRKEIRFGNECKMTTIWFKNGKFAEETPTEKVEEPDYTIELLEEAMDILRI